MKVLVEKLGWGGGRQPSPLPPASLGLTWFKNHKLSGLTFKEKICFRAELGSQTSIYI